MHALSFIEELVTHQCGGCGIWFAWPKSFYKERLNTKKGWYCPNGCSRSFTGKTEAEKAQEELEQVKQRLNHALERENKLRTETEKQKKRLAHGVCPCCNRTFKQLAAHMKNKHPAYLK